MEERKETSQNSTLEKISPKASPPDADADADTDASVKVDQMKIDEPAKVEEMTNFAENDESAVRYIQVNYHLPTFRNLSLYIYSVRKSSV